METMKGRLYLFQCYPQITTTLTFAEYTDDSRTATKEVKVTSDDKGAAAYYAAYGIASDVYCQAESEDDLYVGTFYKDQLKTGEGDSTQMELYPCNNLQLRRAAYAYLYLKKPDGTPYKGSITFHGGVYVNGEYKESARFNLQGTGQNVNQPGDQDQKVSLGADGKLEVVMDQTQWGLEGNAVSAGDDIRYVFQIEQGAEVMMLAGAKTPTEYAIEEIDPYMLRELIQAIYVEAPDKSSGKRRQNIHIKYDGIGFIPLEELMRHE